MARRAKGERNRGQIIRRGDDRYLVRIYLGRREDGKRRYSARIVSGTYKCAERELTKALRELDTGSYVEPSKQTLREHLTSWLDNFARLAVSPRTHEDYHHRLTHDVLPILGERRLDQITSHDVQRLYADMDARGLAPRTIRYTHSVLKQALKRAVIQGALVRNPADHAELPRQKRREMKVLAPEEVSRFLVVTRDDPLHALWAVLLLGGLRPGEALGLRWSDLDGDQLRIVRALRKTTGDQYVLADTKTDGSRRLVLMPTPVVSALQVHRSRQNREILATGPDYERNDLIFANVCGRPMDIAKVRRCFKAALKRAGVTQVRLYDARHTHATLLMGEGVNPKVVSERLGHTNIGITLDTYSHVLPTMQQSVVERLDNLFRVASG